MNETTIAALEQRYRALLADYQAGRSDWATFVAAADDLHFRDASRRYWAIGLETGKWYCHEGQAWQPGDPTAGERPTVLQQEPSPASPRLVAGDACQIAAGGGRDLHGRPGAVGPAGRRRPAC
jgi:hypothetical protein